MYKVVIIDDEQEQVEGIKNVIDWERYELAIAGTADNGVKGLELIERTLPEIAIVDIKMPLMSGLEMLEEVRKRGIKLQSIILSGYDDFYFAQKAITLQTSNYLLKPCRPEQILQSVLKAKNLIVEERRKSAVLKDYQDLIRENLPVLKEKFLTDLLKGNLSDQAAIEQKMVCYGLPFSALTSEYNVVLFSCHCWAAGEQPAPVKTEEYLLLAVMELVKQGLAPEHRCEVLYEREWVIAIIEIRDGACRQELPLQLEKIKQHIEQLYDLSITVGIGGPVSSLALIWRSYQQAATAVETGFFAGDQQIIMYDPQRATGHKYLYPFQEVKKVLLSLETGDEEAVQAAVEKFFQSLVLAGNPGKREIQQLSLTLVSNILQYCFDQNIDLERNGTDILQFFDRILQANTLQQLQEIIGLFLTGIVRQLAADRERNNIVQFAIDYIKENYQSNINLQTIAEQVNYSPSYLSFLFKQETGKNFVDYLNHYRIEQAKKLLRDTNAKNYEIAYQVGYQDEKYFYQIFKKYTGLTASQYRESFRLSKKNS
ncbi:MAG TPA: helix-turn-helix domain-containing protein [Firmicutes bacterium]|uniref:Helix-turn-helix domain-containing protein n=1 Tax=Capillibacterium thermochitinicola TaxID=2699427 RepID=A0A8J6I1C4_9FIRM|nr:helix-turn-helix domain-containing protein [Capillibacterium thermochitinicola]MBA2132487.1 helix-turn-helix domain-containing protein [Capillibacterium thermochitinicola]HHW13033.1 helix-turn-helix domain-containing protein [Bacillota bacterium]